MIGFYLPERSPLSAQTTAAPSKLNAFVRIGADDSVTLMIHKSEMGQGTVTSLSMLLAEELECDWNKIRTEFPGVEQAYAAGGMMGAYGSLSIRTSWQPLRQAGAQAREMLIGAAAQKWGVDKSQCKAQNGSVVNATTNAKLTFGSLADAASKLPVPTGIKLKDASQYRLIGSSMKRLDTAAKVSGKAIFGLDIKRPGMLYASLERCPVFGGKVASFDATKAKAVPGVKNVVQISNGVAVLADNTWAALEGRKALSIQWDEGPRANTSSASLRQMFMDLAAKPGAVARNTGDSEKAMAGASKNLKPCTKLRIFRTLPWSLSTASPTSPTTIAKSGPERKSNPSSSRLRRESQSFLRPRSTSIPNISAAASGAVAERTSLARRWRSPRPSPALP